MKRLEVVKMTQKILQERGTGDDVVATKNVDEDSQGMEERCVGSKIVLFMPYVITIERKFETTILETNMTYESAT